MGNLLWGLINIDDFRSAVNSKSSEAASFIVGSEVSIKALSVATWINGESPRVFERGMVYVFECWFAQRLPCEDSIRQVSLFKEDCSTRRLQAADTNDVDFTVGVTPIDNQLLAGVHSMPQAIVVIDGKIALCAHPSHLDDKNIERLLSGCESAKSMAKISSQIQVKMDHGDDTQKSLVATKRKAAVTAAKDRLNCSKALNFDCLHMRYSDLLLGGIIKFRASALGGMESLRAPYRDMVVINSGITIDFETQSTWLKSATLPAAIGTRSDPLNENRQSLVVSSSSSDDRAKLRVIDIALRPCLLCRDDADGEGFARPFEWILGSSPHARDAASLKSATSTI